MADIKIQGNGKANIVQLWSVHEINFGSKK